jgi:hypothetical protein
MYVPKRLPTKNHCPRYALGSPVAPKPSNANKPTSPHAPPPHCVFLFIVALLLILSIHTESSSISLTCAGLTELPLAPPAVGDVASSATAPPPPPAGSCSSKLNALT